MFFAVFTFEFEKSDYYSLTVGASDNGVPERSSTQTLTLHVSDINDNVPSFTKGIYKAEVAEDAIVMDSFDCSLDLSIGDLLDLP